ncbi:MAG: S1 RNA-binding domain-containing protein [Anaerolineaceae bacterium]|nr:S1 RNA-binding domain-containing protein [Anaerolineaceae bacterium]
MSEENATLDTLESLKTGDQVKGTVKRLELFGAFVDIGVGRDALLHISQLNRPNVRNVEDVLKVGESLDLYVLKVDASAGRIALSMARPVEVDWNELREGAMVQGKIVRIENYGVFVDFGGERPGMVHVSELTNGFVRSPSDVVSIGDEVEARVLKVNRGKRQIDLSMKPAGEVGSFEGLEDEDEEEIPTAMELALRRAMDRTEGIGNTSQRAGKREKRRRHQEDIISRTLRDHQT